jgi:electron transfer flavoprotein alpha/beta subunit
MGDPRSALNSIEVLEGRTLKISREIEGGNEERKGVRLPPLVCSRFRSASMNRVMSACEASGKPLLAHRNWDLAPPL